MSGPTPKDGFSNPSDYKLPKNEKKSERISHRMFLNESPLGSSPKAIEAFKKATEDLFCYPEDWSSSVARRISEMYDLDPERVIIGNGSEVILYFIMFTYLNAGDEVVSSEHGYYLYKLGAEQLGGIPVMVPETDDYKVNIDALIDAVTPKTKIVFVTNPANPTGTILPASEIFRLHDALPSNILLVIDAAYAEYIEQREDYDDFFSLAERPTDNVVVTRSFSKIYGLAGLRIGWSYSSPTVAKVLRGLDSCHYVSTPSQDAALAALGDKEFVLKARAYNDKWLKIFTDELLGSKINITDSHTNFVMLYFEGQDKVERAKGLAEYLAKENILISTLGGYDIPGAIRITIGREDTNIKCIKLIKEFLR